MHEGQNWIGQKSRQQAERGYEKSESSNWRFIQVNSVFLTTLDEKTALCTAVRKNKQGLVLKMTSLPVSHQSILTDCSAHPQASFPTIKTYIKELPGRFSVSCLPAAVFNPLICDNEVVPLAADLFNRKYVTLGSHFLLDALEELRAFPSLIQAPASTDGLDETQNCFGGEIRAGGKRLF